MLVGIMSDSHGDDRATARAVSLLEGRGAERLFHCGDICGERVLNELAGHDCMFVWGNCDQPAPAMRGYVEHLGLPWPQGPLSLRLARKHIAVYHGHERRFAGATKNAALDYLFYGHTHQFSDQRENGCRLINPGALYRARIRTVAILDTETDALCFFQLETGRQVEAPMRG